MKKFVRILCIASAIALLIASFAGCGQNAADSAETTTTAAQATTQATTKAPEPVTMRFSWWGGDTRHQATVEAINLYRQKYPHVTIEAEYQGWDGYEQKIKTQLAGGSAPDIMQMDTPWLPELTGRSDTMFVDMYKQASIDVSAFDADFLKSFCEYGGKLAGLPMGVNSRTVIVNKNAADKAGIALDKPLTYDGLVEMAKTLRAKDKDSYLMLCDTAGLAIMVRSYLKQKNNTDVYNADFTMGISKEDMLEALTWLNDAFDAGVFEPLGDAQLFAGKTEQNPKWINEQMIMIEDWSSGVGKYKGTLPEGGVADVVLPPAVKDAKAGSALVRPATVMCLNGTSASIEEGARFVNWFLTDTEAAVILGDQRAIPAVIAARNAALAAEKLNPVVSKAVEIGSKAPARADSSLSNNSQLEEILKDVIQKIGFNKLTPEQAADEIMTRWTDKLAELKQ